MGKRIGKKIITLIVAFTISIILSAVISTCLHLIFTKQPEQILELTPIKIINGVLFNEQNRQMFIVVILAFMTLAFVSIFRVFKLNDYHAKTYHVTPEIEIPLPVRKKSNTAWFCLVVTRKEI